MSDALRQVVNHYTRTHADAAGIAPTPVPGLFLVRGTAPGGLEHIIACPLVCLVLQGRKQVTLGNRDLSFASGDSMIVPAAMPTVMPPGARGSNPWREAAAQRAPREAAAVQELGRRSLFLRNDRSCGTTTSRFFNICASSV